MHLVWGLVWSVQHIKVPISLLHLLHVCMMSSVWSLKKDVTHHSLQLDISKIMTQNVLHKHQRLHTCWVNWDMKSEKIQMCKCYMNMQLKKMEDFLMQVSITELYFTVVPFNSYSSSNVGSRTAYMKFLYVQVTHQIVWHGLVFCSRHHWGEHLF